jgi:MoaA/NifB/PqqE/SkfB family radical SAM enzyme
MIIERKETWGKLTYDTSRHLFSYTQFNEKDAIPYAEHPVVLNIDLTMKCNMGCLYCVAKDFDQAEDLVVSRKLLNWINESRFMVVVITGGEPLLPEYENQLITLLRETRNKGLIVDTNGTIYPSHSVIKTILGTNALVRISWDSTRSYDEAYFRRAKPNTKPDDEINLEYYHKKIDTIRRLRNAGVNVAVQTVVQKRHLKNLYSIIDMPRMLRELSVSQWFLQRFIPSYKATSKGFEVSNEEYDKVTAKLIKKCREEKIECITKKDRRHNCVVLLVGNGFLYTQGQRPRQKIPLGTIDDPEIRYFDYISSADHAERYYG